MSFAIRINGQSPEMGDCWTPGPADLWVERYDARAIRLVTTRQLDRARRFASILDALDYWRKAGRLLRSSALVLPVPARPVTDRPPATQGSPNAKSRPRSRQGLRPRARRPAAAD